MTRKQKIHQHYLGVIQEKIAGLQQVLTDLKESGANETKSTAGDKHETALAMLQIEQTNTRTQLKEQQQQLAQLQNINPALETKRIMPGSLVSTNKGNFFLSIAAGKMNLEDQTIIAISPESPLGKQLLKAVAGDAVTINTTTYTIISVE